MWQLVLDRPAIRKYEAFAFSSERNGWVVTADGSVLHTRDGGTTWSEQRRGLGFLRSVGFANDSTGLVGTLSGELYRTTDGGESWHDIAGSLPKKALGFCGITNHGSTFHVVGKYVGGAADYFVSHDAGHSWRWVGLDSLAYGLVDVLFVSDTVGFIGGMAAAPTPNLGGAVILRTVDGGHTWRKVFENADGRGFAWKLTVTPNGRLYAALQSQDGTYRVARSSDQGITWEVVVVATDRPARFGLQGIGFLDDTTGWVGGFFRGMYVTVDAGDSWKAVSQPDGLVNRYITVGRSVFAGSTRGIIRTHATRKRSPR